MQKSRAADPACGWPRGSLEVPCAARDNEKTVGLFRPTVRGSCRRRHCRHRTYEVGTELPRTGALKGASVRLVSIELVIPHTSGTTTERLGAGRRSLRAGRARCQTVRSRASARLAGVTTEPADAARNVPSLVALIAQGVLDAELAALVWVLVDGRIPLIVAAPQGRAGAGGQLLTGILSSIHADEPVEGQVAPLTPAGAASLVRGRRAGGVVEAASLGEVRERLGGGPLPLTPDQLTFLGCVLVLGEPADGGGRRGRLRVTAAHYVRPLARDAHGHPQRLDPAVLATWDDRLGRYEHFAWGVLPEIAARLDRRVGDLEGDLHHRRDDLAGLAKAGVTKLDEVQRLIAGYRVRLGSAHGTSEDLESAHLHGPGGGAEHPPH